MEIRKTCEQCGGSGFITQQIKVGDIITLGDGSGMPNALHHILWNGVDKTVSFKPVRVLQVEGNMLAVQPLHWDDKEIRYKEMFDKEVYPALSWIPSADRSVFWTNALHCQPIYLIGKQMRG
jgi:hypothetical protein